MIVALIIALLVLELAGAPRSTARDVCCPYCGEARLLGLCRICRF